MSSAEIYAKEIHDALQRYAAWLPTDKVKVGDVGILHNNIFLKETTLSDFGIDIQQVNDPPSNATYKFMSAGTTETEIGVNAAGRHPLGTAVQGDLKVSFGREDAVYFALANCTGKAIANQRQLGTEVLNRAGKEWKLEYVVVTRVLTAGSATIFQAKSSDASVVLEAGAKDSALQLLSAGASLKVRSQTSIGFSVVADDRLTPLFTLGKVEYTITDKLLGREPKFNSATTAKTAKIGMTRLRNTVKTSPYVSFASPVDDSLDYANLKIMLPKHGDYVEVGHLLDFAANTHPKVSGFSRGLASSLVEKKAKPRTFVSASGAFNNRIRWNRVNALAEPIPEIDLEPSSSIKDYMCLNVRLPKSGSSVDLEPLTTFTCGAIEPKATATITADLAFHEIA